MNSEELATCETQSAESENAEVRALGFSYLPPAGETHVGRIKTKELGTSREDTSTRYNAHYLIIMSLQVFFPRGFLLYIDFRYPPYELSSSIGVRIIIIIIIRNSSYILTDNI